MEDEENFWDQVKKVFKILTEVSKAPLRAVALASYLGDSFPVGARAPPVKDLMAFGTVLQHNQHNIGEFSYLLGPRRHFDLFPKTFRCY